MEKTPKYDCLLVCRVFDAGRFCAVACVSYVLWSAAAYRSPWWLPVEVVLGADDQSEGEAGDQNFADGADREGF